MVGPPAELYVWLPAFFMIGGNRY